MHADLGFGLQRIAERADPFGILRGQERAGGVGHIDALGAIALHQLRLLDEPIRGDHVRHHQKGDRIHAEVAGRLDMLPRDVGLGAMRGDADAARAGIVGGLQIVHRADARQEQDCHQRMLHFLRDGGDPLGVVMQAEAVVEGRAGEPVAMADFDGVHPGGVECAGDCTHLVQRIAVAQRVHAVAQRYVLDEELIRIGAGHYAASFASALPAQRSAVVSAADVMMSRLPA